MRGNKINFQKYAKSRKTSKKITRKSLWKWIIEHQYHCQRPIYPIQWGYCCNRWPLLPLLSGSTENGQSWLWPPVRSSFLRAISFCVIDRNPLYILSIRAIAVEAVQPLSICRSTQSQNTFRWEYFALTAPRWAGVKSLAGRLPPTPFCHSSHSTDSNLGFVTSCAGHAS